MGDIWLADLPDVAADAGLDVRTWPGWQDRARSSGGYDQMWALFAHHTASTADPDSDAAYMWENSDNRPVGAILLERTGRVTVGAAGATNCQGKGGPLTMSRGVIPADKGNTYGLAIEAANDGVGEVWPIVQQEAYVVLCAALCDAYGLDPTRDIVAHFEWTTRKIDPAGASGWADGADSWDMAAFRADVADDTDPEPDPPPDPPPTEEAAMLFMGRLDTNPNLVLIGDGVTAVRVRTDGWAWIESQMGAGLSKWHHPQRAGYPLIADPDDIATFTAGQLRAAVGVEIGESYP